MKNLFLILASYLLMSTANADISEIFGNGQEQDSCKSDYQCESLCCKATGECGAHNPNGREPQFCNKSSGQSCITSEFCSSYTVSICKIYKTGNRPDGTVTCNLSCRPVDLTASCVNQICKPPIQPPIPPFDSRDCSQAIDP